MPCDPKCGYSKTPHIAGEKPIMVSKASDGRFPIGQDHEQCNDCMKEEILESIAKQKLESGVDPSEFELLARFDAFKKKCEKS